MTCPNCRKDLPEDAAECASCGVIVAKFQEKARRVLQGGSLDAVPPSTPDERAAQAGRGAWFYRTLLALFVFMTLPVVQEVTRPRNWWLFLPVLAGYLLLGWHLRAPSLLSWSFLTSAAAAIWVLLLLTISKVGDGPISALAIMLCTPLLVLFTGVLFGLMMYRPGRGAQAASPR